ncbi:MAG: hypothetical protein LBS00_12720 [Synergistaceae bacterium]|jgi:hypothetical protein|nr:hypothetical protein [Synergistaceae bacterium]
MTDNYLFSKYDWTTVQQAQIKQLNEEICGYSSNQLLNTSADALCSYFLDKYRFVVPILHKEDDEIIADQKEVQVDISKDPNRYVSDKSRPFYAQGTEISIIVSFDGDASLFEIRPNKFTMSPPRAIVDGNKNQLLFTFRGVDLQSDNVRTRFYTILKEITDYLGWLSEDVEHFNYQLPKIVQDSIEARKSKLLKDRNLIVGLGFQLKQRPDAITTFVTSQVKRKIQILPPVASTAPFQPEPVLSNDDYHHILKILTDMTLVMERTPSAFTSLDEEAIRTFFLVLLNGHYEGNATGETFNCSGKTDILIRDNGKNIFIAECKFWGGPKLFKETIDQLLGYTSWRDTKTAILLFNKNKDFSKT